MPTMKRIVIIGTSCSGKTTLAKKLSKILGVTHIELDVLHWKQNWIERRNDEFISLVEDAVKENEWISDGNYSMARDILWSHATTIIWLNYPFSLVLYRSIFRSFKRSVTKEIVFSGNRESFKRAFFSRESIILWVIKTHNIKKKKYSKILYSEEHSGLEIIELRSQADTNKFIKSLQVAQQCI